MVVGFVSYLLQFFLKLAVFLGFFFFSKGDLFVWVFLSSYAFCDCNFQGENKTRKNNWRFYLIEFQ